MDLLKEAKKANKESYLALVDKYNVVFYKVARVYHHLDMEIQSSIEKALLSTYHGIINCRNEKSFLLTALQELVNTCEAANKKSSKKKNDSDIAEELQKNAKYRMYKSDSIIETCITNLDKNNRLPALLYFYAGLSVKEISTVANLSKSEVKKSITSSTDKLFSRLRDDYSGKDSEEVIKNAFQSDQISDQHLFDRIYENIKTSKVKVSTFSYGKQVLLVLFLILILLGVCLYLANQYFDIFSLINKNQKTPVANEVTNTVTNTANVVQNKTENKVIENNAVNTINNTTNVVNNVNDVNIASNNTINNSITNTIANEVTNTVSNGAVTNSPDGTVYANLSRSNEVEDYSVINQDEVAKFAKDIMIGIERLSLEEETLESNTILLYIARHYFDTNSSNRNSLDVNLEFTPNVANMHKFLTEFTGKDYTRTNFIRSYKNYIGYTSSSKSYVLGKDIKTLDAEKYTVSNIEITNEFAQNYTAVAKVTRTLGEEVTDYRVTFTFSINQNYKYQKYCLKSIKAINLSFYPDNTVHLVEVSE